MQNKSSDPSKNQYLLSLTTSIVSSYVSNNTTKAAELPKIIEAVYNSLSQQTNANLNKSLPLEPAVSVSASLTPDYIICLEDGRKLKMLKRYLRSRHNMTPEEYRARWNLPSDYPMVAPNYAKRRSDFAKEIGLGRKRAP